MSIASILPETPIRTSLSEWTYRAARRLAGVSLAHVLRLELATMQTPAEPSLDLEYRFLGSGDVRKAATEPSHDLEVSLAARLDSGRDLCFAAFHGDRLANYSWYALDAVEMEHSFGAELYLSRDTVYLYKAYTVPEYRGQRVHGAALYRAADFFRQSGHTQMIAIVEFANWASLRSHARLGFRAAGRLLCIGRKSIGWGCAGLLQPKR